MPESQKEKEFELKKSLELVKIRNRKYKKLGSLVLP